MKHALMLFLLTLTMAVPGETQQPQPDPHSLAYCVNHGGFPDMPMVEPHICACDSPCHEGEPEDIKCLVYCRKDHCHCIAECEHEPPPEEPSP